MELQQLPSCLLSVAGVNVNPVRSMSFETQESTSTVILAQ